SLLVHAVRPCLIFHGSLYASTEEKPFGIWLLELLWDLEFGIWSFSRDTRPAFRHWHAISFSFPRIDVSILDVQDANAGFWAGFTKHPCCEALPSWACTDHSCPTFKLVRPESGHCQLFSRRLERHHHDLSMVQGCSSHPRRQLCHLQHSGLT